jgi:hypothetical protein
MQALRDGVLRLELEDVEKLDKPKGAAVTIRAEWKHGQVRHFGILGPAQSVDSEHERRQHAPM